MKHKNETISSISSHSPQDLERRANDRARKLSDSATIMSASELEKLTPDAIQHMLHQLQVHQIELEMQNEQLLDTQLQLETAHLRYFDLYDLAPVGYCSVTEQGAIVEANLLAANLLGKTRSTLVNNMLSNFILAGDKVIYFQHRKQLLESGQSQTFELQMLGADNTPFWAQLKTSVEGSTLGPAILRIVFNDISERKKAEIQHALIEESLLKSNTLLEQATTAAKKANHEKTDFLSNLSHELRTPLNSILGFAQMLESGTPALSAKQKANIEQILDGGWYLLKLINEILDLALIESGKLKIVMESVRLQNLLSNCIAMVEMQAENRDIRLDVADIEYLQTAKTETSNAVTSITETNNDSRACLVYADPTRLQQVLINLLSNAIKYNKIGGTVDIKCIEMPNGRMRIGIKDSGLGLSPEEIALLFQPFNRLGQETGEEEGTGLGLVMTKRLIELMQGEIGVESSKGKGCLFWVELKSTETS